MIIDTEISPELLENPVIPELSAACGIPNILTTILFSMGYTDREEILSFLYPTAATLHSPFELKDMEKAVNRIEEAIDRGEKILIYGDYDADGVTSTALLYLYLTERGTTPVCYIPNRLKEGYGISTAVLDRFSSEHFNLMITVDTGCSAGTEIAHARILGIDTVVTDHHECCKELPDCWAVVNPMRKDCSYPFKGLAGVGVVFKLIGALERSRMPEKSPLEIDDRLLARYSDIVAIGTVADVMPLTDENRYIVKKGLERLTKTERPGLSSLVSLIQSGKGARSAVNVSFIGYGIAPRINAAGRMGDGHCALDLFLARSAAEGKKISEELCRLNVERQKEEARIFQDACLAIDSGKYSKDSVLVLANDRWHQGVIGIVASRIVERYGKSAILFTSDGDLLKGSGRSVKGVDLTAILAENAEILVKYGGHEQAAGMTLKREDLDEFRKRINAGIHDSENVAVAEQRCEVLLSLAPYDITFGLAESLKLLEPCGNGNPSPLFSAQSLTVSKIIPLSGGKHTKLLLEKEGITFVSLLFGSAPETLPFWEGDAVDAVFELSVNEYMGKKSLQLMLKNVFLSTKSAEIWTSDEKPYQSLTLQNQRIDEAFIPSREDFGKVYRCLRELETRGVQRVSLRRLCDGCLEKIRLMKCELILDVFEEMGLIERDAALPGETVISFRLKNRESKVNLSDSKILNGLAVLPYATCRNGKSDVNISEMQKEFCVEQKT